jgi:hypothetical protein
MISRPRELTIVVLTLVLALPTLVAAGSSAGPIPPPPNIVVVLMDDIGIDQWELFGYGGTTPAATPNIAAIANGGIMFHNMWAMPACSNGRAALFTGRYPFRTNVFTAIGSNDLANYMVNPNEITLPKLLKQRGYQSALFGKFHLGIQANDPYGLAMVHALGFDYFDGWLDETGDPSSIDTTAGGVPGNWSCGFVRDAAHSGADTGACYAADGTCSVITKTSAEAPGRVCRDSGGIFDPNQACTSPPPANLNFSTYSGHYVSPLVINYADGTVEQVPATDLRARTWRATELVDAAIAWVQQQPRNQPWMAALSFSLTHTPFMQPPSQTLPRTEPDSSNLECTSGSSDSTTGGDCSFGCNNIADQRLISNEMEESLDFEIGRFLTTTGIATAGPNGRLLYNPGKTNTYVIFVTDNGSLGSVVKPPFDPTRAKSTAYQTGVWVPGIVAGPGVVKPGRETDAMVNIVDIYQLVGELAGIDVHKQVKWIVDAQSMLPYLTNPKQPSIRRTNYTEIGTNQHADGEINGPCVYGGNTCTQIAPTPGVCQDNNGVWWGQGATAPGTNPAGEQFCCDVAIYQHDHNEPVIGTIYPLSSYAIRNDHYKLVVSQYKNYDPGTNACVDTTSDEFYEINEDDPPKLDTAPSDLLARKKPLSSEQRRNYVALRKQVNALHNRQPFCTADINLDRVVNELDIDQWSMFEALTSGSSWADINQDGLTDGVDEGLIMQHFGACPNKAHSAGLGG